MKEDRTTEPVDKTPDKAGSGSKPRQYDEVTTWLDDNWTWSQPSTWPLSVRFLPIFVALVVVFIGVYVHNYMTS